MVRQPIDKAAIAEAALHGHREVSRSKRGRKVDSHGRSPPCFGKETNARHERRVDEKIGALARLGDAFKKRAKFLFVARPRKRAKKAVILYGSGERMDDVSCKLCCRMMGDTVRGDPFAEIRRGGQEHIIPCGLQRLARGEKGFDIAARS